MEGRDILAREFVCPVCGADIRERCITVTGKRVSYSHIERYRLWVNDYLQEREDDYKLAQDMEA